ncbi:MAG: hypothetical protein JWM59_3135 [Verrucomicrobiales bacterium]|nr:hypothetical protein [Verrucomicrobiales bacterium]
MTDLDGAHPRLSKGQLHLSRDYEESTLCSGDHDPHFHSHP